MNATYRREVICTVLKDGQERDFGPSISEGLISIRLTFGKKSDFIPISESTALGLSKLLLRHWEEKPEFLAARLVFCRPVNDAKTTWHVRIEQPFND